MFPKTVWEALERGALLIGGLGAALIAIDGVLATEHSPKGYLLGWGFGLVVFASIVGLAGIVGQHFSRKRSTNPPGRPIKPIEPQSFVAHLAPGSIYSASAWAPANPGDPEVFRAELIPAERKPLVLTLREFGTYAEYRADPHPARPILGVHVAVYAANPGGVPVVLLESRLEHILLGLHGAVQIEGTPYMPDPTPTAMPGSASGTVRLAESDPAYPTLGHLTVEPGATHLLDAIVIFAIAEPGEPHAVPQSIGGSLVLVDELHGEHSGVDFRCQVSMNLT